MSDTKHSPGPWRTDHDDPYFVTRHGVPGASVIASLHPGRIPQAERWANAHLIAAAPEMYEHLNTAADALGIAIGWLGELLSTRVRTDKDETEIDNLCHWRASIKQTLAKAEGRQTDVR